MRERSDDDDPVRSARAGAAGTASADTRNRVSIQIVSFRALSAGADATPFAEGMTQELSETVCREVPHGGGLES